MTSQKKPNKKSHLRRQERRFSLRSVRRDAPDMRKLGKALLGLAMAEAEREAQTQQDDTGKPASRATSKRDARQGDQQDG